MGPAGPLNVPRARLGVVLPVPEPVAAEIDGLRRAVGDGALGRIPAHLTLVPPVNVPLAQVEEAQQIVGAAAAGSGRLRCQLGPPTTFWPVTPVLYLGVSEKEGVPGEWSHLRDLQAAVFRPPLWRKVDHDFVPHVTLADEIDPERIGPAVEVLSGFERVVTFDRITILREGEGRRWSPVFEAALDGASVVGRGGLPLALSSSPTPDALTRARTGAPPGLCVTAHREGVAVGLAECRAGTTDRRVARLVDLWVTEGERGTGVGSHLLAALSARAADDLGAAVLAYRPAGRADDTLSGFLRHRGFIVEGAVLVRRLGP